MSECQSLSVRVKEAKVKLFLKQCLETRKSLKRILQVPVEPGVTMKTSWVGNETGPSSHSFVGNQGFWDDCHQEEV